MKGLVIILLGAVSSVLASTPRVNCTRSSPADLSGNVTLTCEFLADLEVLQITWQKKRGKDSQNMVTFSEKYGIHITEPFKKHITVLNTPLPKSCISITKLEKEDEACYNCLFNAYPNGAFTGEVCLTDLRSAHEVSCIGQGNDLRIDLNPQEIRTRTSVQLIEKKTGDFSTVKGQYSDPRINPTCEFWLEKESVEENKNNPPEDTFFTQCSASGNKKFNITWNNKGQPVSQEEKMNITGNITTVTSTLIHNVSSLPAGQRLKCTVKLIGEPLEAYPEKAALSAKEPTLGNFNKGDTENKDQQQRPWTRYLMIAFAGFLPLVIFSVFLFYYKVWKKKEAKTPKKQVEKGPETPPSSIKKLFGVIKKWSSPKSSTENECGPARSPSPMNNGTPSNSDQRNPRENLESLTKRNLHGSEKKTSSRKLQFMSN